MYNHTRISCPCCELVRINGVICHEKGCPNTNARYDADEERWVKQHTCVECGSKHDDRDDAAACCAGIDPDDSTDYDTLGESYEHFAHDSDFSMRDVE